MSIWILALIVVLAVTLAGWRQGAIRAASTTVGILFAVLLAVPVGKLAHLLLPFVGISNPIIAWAVSPLVGFILVSIAFMVAGQMVHGKIEHFYRYNAGDLRMALWERLNARLGICLGVLNGVIYFVLISFVIFNLSYLTSQIATAPSQPLIVRLANQLGGDLEAGGLSRTATAVGTLPPMYYQLSDLSGFLMQNPKAGPRFAEYPALTSLWEQPEMQNLVSDKTLTGALETGATLGDILSDPAVKEFLASKELTKLVAGILTDNMDDLMPYLQTGKSAKYDQKIIGRWVFNPNVTIAWIRQSRPKMSANEMRSLRAFYTQAYENTHVLVAGDNKIFLKSLPRVKSAGPNQQPSIDHNDWKGDWTPKGNSYDLHLTFNSEDKFMTAEAEELRLFIKDGKGLMVFDRAD